MASHLLSALFYKRLKDDRQEYWCDECGLGPFPSKRSLDGHISRAHKAVRKKELLKGKANGVYR